MVTRTGEFVPWPVPLHKPQAEWTDFDRDFFDFMTAACAEGFRPRMDWTGNPEAGDLASRQVFLVRRGVRNGWEPFLCETGVEVRLGPSVGLGQSRCVVVRPPFRAVAHFALEWLRGRPLHAILADFVFVGGYPSGIELRPDAAIPSHVIQGDQAANARGSSR